MTLRVRAPTTAAAGPSRPPAPPGVGGVRGRGEGRRIAVVSLALMVAFGLSLLPISRPDPRSNAAPPSVFSAGRAMPHANVIAARAHPAGSPAMAQVARYVEGQLRSFGLETRGQVVKRRGVTIRNVVGRIRGSATTGAVLFVSHPDSVPFGPGGGDNATGAAVLLEMSRALAAGPRLRNDVIVLFDDDEEGGVGADDPPFGGGTAFAKQHPWMKDVRLVVGMDTAAWGVPHVLQTSDDDGLLVRGYADSVADPIAFGLTAALTDNQFETFPFKEQGLPAIELEDNYADNVQHTARDTVAHVQPASVQHMGDQALELAGAYAGMDLTDSAQPSRVFHTFPVVGVVHYPAAWSVGLALLAVVAFAVVAFSALTRDVLRARDLLKGAALATVLLVAVILLATSAAALYEALFPNPSPHPVEEYLLDSSAPFEIVAVTLIAAAFGFAYRALARRIGHVALGLGFVALWLVFTVVFAAAVPAAAYAFEWPLLLACVAWLAVLRARRAALSLLLPAALAVFLLAPVLVLGFLSDGVAGLPDLALAIALAAGLIAPAILRPPDCREPRA